MDGDPKKSGSVRGHLPFVITPEAEDLLSFKVRTQIVPIKPPEPVLICAVDNELIDFIPRGGCSGIELISPDPNRWVETLHNPTNHEISMEEARRLMGVERGIEVHVREHTSPQHVARAVREAILMDQVRRLDFAGEVTSWE